MGLSTRHWPPSRLDTTTLSHTALILACCCSLWAAGMRTKHRSSPLQEVRVP